MTAKYISSKDNLKVRALKALVEDARERRAQKLAVLEGHHLVQAARHANVKIRQTFIAESVFEGAEFLEWRQTDHEVFVVSDAIFRSLSALSQGVSILQIFEQPAEVTAPQSQQNDHHSNTKIMSLYLEAIQDPGNLGTLLRTAAAAGCGTVYLSQHCADVWSPKVLRAAMGAHFSIAITSDVDFAALAKTWPGMVLGTSLQTRRNLYAMPLNEPALWCFGNEGAGLSEPTLDAIVNHVRGSLVFIPQSAAVESLNVAAAAAVCLFEQRRQVMLQQ